MKEVEYEWVLLNVLYNEDLVRLEIAFQEKDAELYLLLLLWTRERQTGVKPLMIKQMTQHTPWER